MAGEARHSDRIIAEARRSLTDQRAGGRRIAGKAIGRGSAGLRRRHAVGKAKRAVGAVVAILVAAFIGGLVIDGIGIVGVMLTVLAMVAAMVAFSVFPRMKIPRIETLNQGSVAAMVGRTEVWLEAQRPALPAPAVQIVDHLGMQLDALGSQLQTLPEGEPAIGEVRKLVGEQLPSMIESYRRIPAHLRREEKNGVTPEAQLADGLGKISAEVDSITRQIAAGDIDALAVRTRYLDYKYGAGADTPELPTPDKVS